MGFTVDGVERLPLQTAVADTAGETCYVEHTVHGRATGAFTHDLQTAIGTHSWRRREREREENQHEYVNSNSGQGRAGHKAERGKNISVLDADIYAPNKSLFLSCLWPPWLFFLLLLRFQNTSESVDPLMNEVAEFVFQSALDDAS